MGHISDSRIAFHSLDKEVSGAWALIFPKYLIRYDSAKFLEANANKLVELQCGGIVPVLLQYLRTLMNSKTANDFNTQIGVFLDTWTPVIPEYIKYFTDTWLADFP